MTTRTAGTSFTDRGEGMHREKELKYRTVADFAYDWAYWQEPGGPLCYISPSCKRITGYNPAEFQGNPSLLSSIIVPEDRPAWDEHTRCCHHDKEPGAVEFRIRRRDGAVVWIEHVCRPVLDENGAFLGIRASNRDITDRKQAESERIITVQLLSKASFATSLRELLDGITSDLRRWSGCEAVGIRLRDGDDYPYYETRGFPPEFVQAENRLCAVDEQGRIVRDSSGSPVLECMCGNVLCGRFDPTLPFFTERGSFWTNCTTELLASTTEAERQARTRDRCNGEGYESVALIPLRAAGETFGLLQFNDRRPGMFSPNGVELFERLAYSIASAVAQQRGLAALRASEERLRQQQRVLAQAQRIAHVGSWELDYARQRCTASDEAFRIHGLDADPGEVAHETFLDLVHPDEREAVEAAVIRTEQDPTGGYEMQYRLVRPDGAERFVHVRGEVICDDAGRPVRMVGITHDITEQKRAELKLRNALKEVAHLRDRLRAENIYLQEEIKSSYDFEEIVGQSEPLRLTLSKIEHVAETDANVLLLGETGTGTELFARAIHDRSFRKGRPLVKVNCAALPSSLIESELFGHVKGAFTGAISDKVGRFQLADGGTLFLDEIGELDPDMQIKLLRVLQEGEFERIGSGETIKVDARVIAATNRDLHASMARGSFRPDLYYRLAVFPIELPPLRLRRNDIPLLVWHFIEAKRARLGKTIESIPRSAMNALTKYDWPGNVRELENVIERAMILSPGPSLLLEESFAKAGWSRPPASTSHNLEDIDRAHIISVLEDRNWKIKGEGNAADRLGLKPSTLRYRMRKLGIHRP